MPSRGRPVGLVLGLLLAWFTLAACTGAAAPATGSGGSQGQPDPCSLLTQAEIKAQFEFPVAPGIPSSTGGGAISPECDWNPVDYHPSFGEVSLVVQKFDQGFFDFTKGPDDKDVAGLGDAAYFDQPTNPFTLRIKKGNLELTLTVSAGSGSSATPEDSSKKSSPLRTTCSLVSDRAIS